MAFEQFKVDYKRSQRQEASIVPAYSQHTFHAHYTYSPKGALQKVLS